MSATPLTDAKVVPCELCGCGTPGAYCSPATVWVVQNKSAALIFATEQDAKKYVSGFGASVGGGMSISEVPVIRS